jgi:uncharacterized membrane protein
MQKLLAKSQEAPLRPLVAPVLTLPLVFHSPTNQLPMNSWKPLILLALAGVAMWAARLWRTDEITYAFLIWNLFLAWVPLGAAWVFGRALGREQAKAVGVPHPPQAYLLAGWPGGVPPRWLAGGAFVTWLLFLPNSPYIITDLIHLHHMAGQALWYDALMIFFFALGGLLAGLVSVAAIHRSLRRVVGRWPAWGTIIGCLILCGFGVFLGRFQRWNSWDALQDPTGLASDIAFQLQNPYAVKVSLVFALAMIVLYLGLVLSAPRRLV